MSLRIVHIASDDGWGGGESSLWNLISAQTHLKEIHPCLVTLNDGRLTKLARESGIEIRLVQESGRTFLDLAKKVRQALGELSPAIIHTHRYKEMFLAITLAPYHKARVLLTIHGYEPPNNELTAVKVSIRDFVLFFLSKLVRARFVAVSKDLRQKYRLSSSKCQIIPNGIPICEDEVSRGEKRDHAIYPVIGWVGRMIPIKGLHVLLEAIAIMSKGQVQPLLLLVGDGPERLKLESKAKELGISQRVQFIGAVKSPREFLKTMDIFAFPSLHEGVPLAMLEALEAGVPVVASAVGGIPEVIGVDGVAVLMNSHSPDDWAATMSELLKNSKRMADLATRGRLHVKKHFSVEHMVESYSKVYLSMLHLNQKASVGS